MNPVGLLPSFLALSIAVITTKIITKLVKIKPTEVRFESIDGLRGYLAFFVFLHHSSIWYFYLRTNNWTNPPSNIYNHFGGTSVAMFFMITGFLFFSKLNYDQPTTTYWFRFYISRTMRLAPVYLFSLSFVLIIVCILSGFSLHEPLYKIFKELISWSTFTVIGAPNVNGILNTQSIVAGVTWSLKYEWLFYFFLPLAGLIFFRKKPNIVTLVITAIAIALILIYNNILFEHLFPFIGGIMASLLVRSATFCFWASKNLSSAIVILCLVLAILMFPTPENYISLLLISVAFIFIACGNTIFGLLTTSTSRTLGQMSYCIYLLHGIILFCVFKFIVASPSTLSPVGHWFIICLCTFPLISICYATHLYIELPFIKATSNMNVLATKYFNIVNKSITEQSKSN